MFYQIFIFFTFVGTTWLTFKFFHAASAEVQPFKRAFNLNLMVFYNLVLSATVSYWVWVKGNVWSLFITLNVFEETSIILLSYL